MRYTRKFIDARFAMAMNTIGAKNCSIDYYSYGGGYMIVQHVPERDGERTPFGHTRYRAAAFVDHLTTIMDTHRFITEIAQKQGVYMHGLETIRKLNNALPANAAQTTVPTEADELKDIEQLVRVLRSGRADTTHGVISYVPVSLDVADAIRAADYLVAAYGIEE